MDVWKVVSRTLDSYEMQPSHKQSLIRDASCLLFQEFKIQKILNKSQITKNA
jgi:hypothetical protein